MILAILKVIDPKFGFKLYLHSDFPLGSGLGGSATLAAAVLGCFNMMRQDRWSRHELAEIAFQAERLYLGQLVVGKINMLLFLEVLIFGV